MCIRDSQRPWFEDSTSGSVFTRVTFWLQIALAAIILGILVFVIIRSARPLTVEETEPELSVEQMLAATKENQPAVDDIDMQDKSETRKAIEKFVDENPEAVALLLRNWLNDEMCIRDRNMLGQCMIQKKRRKFRMHMKR